LVVIVAIIVDKNQILSAKRSSSKHLVGHWEFPDGNIKLGETPGQYLKCKLKEEFTMGLKMVGLLLKASLIMLISTSEFWPIR